MTACPALKRARPAVQALKAYSSARSLVKTQADTIYLDANEMPFEPLPGVEGYSRYAGQQPEALVAALAGLYGVPTENLLVARGADEAIDVLIRCFCEAGSDAIIICPPAFPMYAQSAAVQGAAVKKVPLRADFTPDVPAIAAAIDDATKIVFLCTPNNPTGNALSLTAIEDICHTMPDDVLIVMDEAYVEFSDTPSCISLCNRYSNLIVLRTLSKAYALAGVRCGVMIAHAEIVALSRKALAPYPLPVPVIETVMRVLKPANRERLELRRAEILQTRDSFSEQLKNLEDVKQIYPSDANYLLVRWRDASAIIARCRAAGIILRDQSHQPGLTDCIRISIGTPAEMNALLAVLETGERPPVKGRAAIVTRQTRETAIRVAVNLDQTSPVHIHTGVGFYDHMLDQVARHGGFALELECVGDLEIDAHHTIEDCAIALGQALRHALGDKAGIGRYGFVLPMDESLAQAVIDLSGRAFLKFDADFPAPAVGDLPTDMIEHIFRSLAENLHATLHISVSGDNAHHMVEGCFKAFARALRQAIRKEGDALPSTKGML